ncbi:unnamed protein product [Withania somnifera]
MERRPPNENGFVENIVQDSIFSSNMFLDGDGEVILTQTFDRLSWKSVESLLNGQDPLSCFGTSKSENTLYVGNIYSAEFIDWGLKLIHEAAFLGQSFEVTVTERAGQAFDIMASITKRGGDGFFNEILNGLLLLRHKCSYPPSPTELCYPAENNGSVLDTNVDIRDPSDSSEDESPLLKQSTNLRTEEDSCRSDEEDLEFSFPNEKFRFGLIPAGSTDAIVICTTGARDAMTSALQTILGKAVCLDIAQVIRWKKTSTSKDEPCVRYAASFAGYGFYGDVITESEKYMWMGPKRYDAGTKVFLHHRLYEAEVAYVEVESEKKNIGLEKELTTSWTKGLCSLLKKSERVACCANCNICKTKAGHKSAKCPSLQPYSKDSRWLKSKGQFLSVGAAVISCRNEKAPHGLVADAYLSDGFLHLILFVTPAFTFTSYGKESIWNVDGELFQAHQLSAQVFCGLINLFASGPEA